MANRMYPKTKTAMMKGQVDLLSADVRVILVDLADYAYSAAHEMLSDVPAAARVAVSPSLTGKTVGTVAEGVFDADDTSFATVSGDTSEALIVYIHTGVESTSRLVQFLDTGVSGLPVTPNGANITLGFNAAGIARINDV